MNTFAIEVLVEQASHLTQEEQLLLLEKLASMMRAHTQPTADTPKKRVLGMYEGKMWMAQDFTAPLPDEFWG